MFKLSNFKCYLIILVVGLMVFGGAVNNKFVWDDEEEVVNNYVVHDVKNIPQFFKGSTFNSGGGVQLGGIYYRPLMMTTFSLLYHFFGPNPAAFHGVQIGIHIANAILVFLLFRFVIFGQTQGSAPTWLPLFGALVFLVHPLNVEAAVYTAAMQDTLFFFFGMMGFLLIFNFQFSIFNKFTINQFLKIKQIVVVLLGGLFLLLSMMAKETGVAFLIIFNFPHFAKASAGRQFLKRVGVSVGILATYVFLRVGVGGVGITHSSLFPITQASFIERLMTMPKILFYYISNFFWPKDLAISQHWVVKSLTLGEFWGPVLFDLIVLALFFIIFCLTLRKLKKDYPFYKRIILFWVLWAIVGFLMHLQIIPLDMTVADRWGYFTMVGMVGILVNLGILGKLGRLGKLGMILIIIFLSMRSMVRVSDWRDGLTLFGHDIKISKNAFDLENNFGVELFRAGRTDEACEHFKKSTEIAPYWWTNWSNLGVCYQKDGEVKEAIVSYQKAIDNGQYYLAFENMAGILYNLKDFSKCAEFTKKALTVLPNNEKLKAIYSECKKN